MYTVSGKRDLEYFVHNIFKRSVESAALLVQQMSTSRSQCCYFTLQNEMFTTASKWTKCTKTGNGNKVAISTILDAKTVLEMSNVVFEAH